MENLDRPKPRRKLVGFRLPEDLGKELKVRAAVEGTTMSRIVEEAIITWMGTNLAETLEAARQIGMDLHPLIEKIEASTGRKFLIVPSEQPQSRHPNSLISRLSASFRRDPN